MFKPGTGVTISRGWGAWPLFAMLLLAVVVPTAGLLWFMTQAMRNERLAVQQRLQEAYRGQLADARTRLGTYCRDALNSLASAGATIDPNLPSRAFADLIKRNLADGIVVCAPSFTTPDNALYPAARPRPVRFSSRDPETTEWLTAETLENQQGDARQASAAYARIAEATADIHVQGRALLAQARCLGRIGEKARAIDILIRTLGSPNYHLAEDAEERLIQPDALIRGLELLADPNLPEYRATAETLARRLSDYDDMRLGTQQRRFLMHRLKALWPACPPFSTLEGEDLTCEYLSSRSVPPQTDRFTPTALNGIWQLASRDLRLVAIFREERLIRDMASSLATAGTPPGTLLGVIPPKMESSGPEPFLSEPAGEFLPEWRLGVYLQDSDPFALAADRQIAAYLWTGVLTILAMAALAALMAGTVLRQIRLTRLKNDLIATVTHELKTPLASMRVLTDTLLSGHVRDEAQRRDYVRLMSQENERLSHLIDNFLTFSRMERNKRSFDLRDVNMEQVVAASIEALGDRLHSPDCRLQVDLAPDLPTVRGDRDALVTVLVNLLDNALKYSDDDKRITVRTRTEDGCLLVEVQDNGIGLSRRAARKVFDRFYQVDDTLSRRAGGCGLGLSIVQYIVESHGGTVSVRSDPGKGSTFTVRLPLDRPVG